VFIKLTEALKELLKETARQLRGATKRKFMAQTVQKLGKKGIRLAELELGWNRITINKGIKELRTELLVWITIQDEEEKNQGSPDKEVISFRYIRKYNIVIEMLNPLYSKS